MAKNDGRKSRLEAELAQARARVRELERALESEGGSGAATDDSGRHYLERELRQLLSNDATIFEFLRKGSLDGVWYWDMEHPEHEWMSSEFWRLFGYEPEEKAHLVSEWKKLIFPEDLEVARENLRRHCQDPAHPYDQVARYRHRNGSTVWVRCRGIVIRDRNGTPVRMLGAHNDLTEQKRAQEALKESERRFRLLYMDAPIAYQSLDENGNFLDVNKAFCETLGYDAEDIVGTSFADLLHPHWRDHFRENFPRFKAVGEVLGVEFKLRRKDGRYIHVAFDGRIGRDEDGAFRRTHCVFRDVSRERKAQQKLQETLNRLTFHVDNSPLGVVEWEGGMRIKSWSGRAEAFFGWSADEVVGKSWDDFAFIHPEDEHIVAEKVARLFDGTETFNTSENRNLRKDGSVVHCHWYNSSLRDADGNMVSILSQVADVTRLKQAEQALRESNEKFRLAFDASPDAVNINRLADGLYVEINQGFTRLTGFTAQDVLGKTSLDIGIWADPADRERLVAALSADGFCDNLEAQFRRKDGSVTTALMSARVITLKDEPHIISITRDISRIKRSRDELRRAKEEAEAANRVKSEFLANMSHEIRTPLNGILGMLQLLETSTLGKRQAEYVQSAMRSSRRLTRLLSDILDLSRVEADRLSLQCAPFDPAEVVESVCELFQSAAGRAGLELRVNLDPSLPSRLSGDAARLQQVLTNLVGNACKFTRQGSVEVEVFSLPEIDPGRSRVLFVVSDTGIGIPRDQLDTLFRPFTQVSRGYRRDHQGAGLGLSICRRLVGLMGGTIAVESEQDQGTTVHFCLGFDSAGLTGHGPEPAAPEPRRIAPLRILLVEDERLNRKATAMLLENRGHAVATATNGREALEALAAELFDLVLMDVQMPVMDGVEATQAIRAGQAGERARKVPIAAMTAYAMDGDRETFLAAGMDGYVAKPLEMEQLDELFVRLLAPKPQ